MLEGFRCNKYRVLFWISKNRFMGKKTPRWNWKFHTEFCLWETQQKEICIIEGVLFGCSLSDVRNIKAGTMSVRIFCLFKHSLILFKRIKWMRIWVLLKLKFIFSGSSAVQQFSNSADLKIFIFWETVSQVLIFFSQIFIKNH